jgi:phosphatidylserine decarboxylase
LLSQYSQRIGLGVLRYLEHVFSFVLTKQIAGAIARRIVTYVKEGEIVHIGSPLGFIKLGSRMDIYLPLDSEILVNIGEEVRANVTFLARLTKEENK